MPMTREEVTQIATLARLALTDDEISLFQAQLSAILDYATTLQSLDTHAVSPTATVLPLHTVLREDVPNAPLPQDEALINAPRAWAGCFLTPPIIVKG